MIKLFNNHILFKYILLFSQDDFLSISFRIVSYFYWLMIFNKSCTSTFFIIATCNENKFLIIDFTIQLRQNKKNESLSHN